MSAGHEALRVLAVLDDIQVARTIQGVLSGEGDEYKRVTSVEEAVTSVASEPVDVAFVELRAEAGAALALCHHIPSVAPEVAVYAIVHPSDLARGPEALSLGATALLLCPLTGDAVARVLADAKAERARRRAVTALTKDLAYERRRVELYDRLVGYARTGRSAEAVLGIVEGVLALGGCTAVALYAGSSADGAELVRLAVAGTGMDLPSSPRRDDLSALAATTHGRLLPLATASGELGLLFIAELDPERETHVWALADLAAAMLSLLDRGERFEGREQMLPSRDFQSVAERFLALAVRHDRRASVLAISAGGRGRDEVLADLSDVLRHTDALCGTEEGDLLLFLPETTSAGAHACRRRVVARLSGDRRARPGGTIPTALVDSSPTKARVTVGVAAFPHDGTTLRRLVRTARSRRREDALSSVAKLGLDAMSLPDMVDTLLSTLVIDAGPRSPYPLDVAHSGLVSIVQRTCRDALRGGEAHVLATQQPALGLGGAPAPIAAKPRILDVRNHPRCEDLAAIVVEAEHGVWVCCGRVDAGRFRGIHAADPLLGDLVVRRLSELGGLRAG